MASVGTMKKSFAKAMWTRIGEAREAGGDDDRDCREAEHRQGQDQNGKDRHLDLSRLDLFAEIFRGSANHQARHEDRDDREEQHPIKTRPDAAEDDLAEHDVDHRHHAGEREQAVVHIVDGAAGGVGRDGREEGGIGDAEPYLLALHVAAGLKCAWRGVDGKVRESRIAAAFGCINCECSGQEQNAHDGEDRPALALLADHPAEHIGQRRTDREDQDDLNWR